MRISSLLSLVLLFAAGQLWAENQNPVANAGPDQTVSASAQCLTSVKLDGTASTDPDGDTLTFTWSGGFTEGNGITTGASPTVTLGSGVHNIMLVVDDGHGGLATDVVQITVTDTTAPVISGITASPSVLWPPNHKFHSVTVLPHVTDNCDAHPVCKITAVKSSETDRKTGRKQEDDGNGNGNGNGNGHGHGNDKFSPDFVITGDLTVDLRAERSGRSTGRIYTITIVCTDRDGNSTTSTVDVTVPHDQRNHERAEFGRF